MPLMLDDLRAEFARFLSTDPGGRFRMDAALVHVLTLAYCAGISEVTPPCEPSEQQGKVELMTAGKTAAQGGT